MSPSKHRAEILALRDAALEDLMATSDEELLREAAVDGVDVKALADKMGADMHNAAAEALREHAALAKQRAQSKASSRTNSRRPAIDAIKRIVGQAFQRDPRLGLAFRSGTRQSDEDWGTVYDDLIELGEIDPDSNVD